MVGSATKEYSGHDIRFQAGPDSNEFSSWSFTNIYFLDNMTDNHPEPNLHKDVPARLHIMNHIYRWSDPGSYQIKLICPQERQLHPTGPLHQVLPQQRTYSCSSQPLSQGLRRWRLVFYLKTETFSNNACVRWLQEREHAQWAWPPATLQVLTGHYLKSSLFCRKDCAHPIRMTCKEKYGTFVERDTTVWQWREKVVEKMAEVFQKLGLIL